MNKNILIGIIITLMIIIGAGYGNGLVTKSIPTQVSYQEEYKESKQVPYEESYVVQQNVPYQEAYQESYMESYQEPQYITYTVLFIGNKHV